MVGTSVGAARARRCVAGRKPLRISTHTPTKRCAACRAWPGATGAAAGRAGPRGGGAGSGRMARGQSSGSIARPRVAGASGASSSYGGSSGGAGRTRMTTGESNAGRVSVASATVTVSPQSLRLPSFASDEISTRPRGQASSLLCLLSFAFSTEGYMAHLPQARLAEPPKMPRWIPPASGVSEVRGALPRRWGGGARQACVCQRSRLAHGTSRPTNTDKGLADSRPTARRPPCRSADWP
jgi:hypothetical protein